MNAFNQQTIDFSEAEIYQLSTSKLPRWKLEAFLQNANQYTRDKFILWAKRLEEMKKVVQTEEYEKIREEERKKNMEGAFDLNQKNKLTKD